MRPVSGMLAFMAALSPIHALGDEDVARFYIGKQVQLIVGVAAGGAYDVVGRAVGRHIGRHIPGAPSVVVQNMPGAGSLAMGNHVYNVAARDGTVFGLANNGVATAPALTPGSARFDPAKFSWIGSSNREHLVVAVTVRSAAKTMQDMFTTEVIVGAVNTGSANLDYPLVTNAVLGTKFKVISGYEGISGIDLAMERGEVQGNAGLGWVYAKAQHAAALNEGRLIVLAQHGFRKHADLPDAPLLPAGKTEADRQALVLIYARQDYGRPFFGPPDIPEIRLAALRKAFDATLRDREFLAEAEKLKIDIDPVSGEELAALTKEITAIPPEVAARVRAILAGAK